MNPKFAYSFDRELFHGEFSTRQQAYEAAINALTSRSDLPEAIYVGRWAAQDLQTSDHAETIINNIRDRWESAYSNSNFLSRLNEQQVADLDYELDRTIRTWLTKHDLTPRLTSVQAVSEYPVPNVQNTAATNSQRTMSSIGNSDITPQ